MIYDIQNNNLNSGIRNKARAFFRDVVEAVSGTEQDFTE